ncbi:hypothetical protein EAF00_006891 [Botryotinia globosa]|nr:hypothetical protein EAF00_006891 [Botryotinia globosa]
MAFPEFKPGCTTEERTKNWIGTIAHELIHAFLFIFGCDGCHSLVEQAGPYGREHAWQAAAYRIEIACGRLLSNNGRLSRWASLSDEVENWGLPMPEERLLRRWNMIGPEDYEQTPEVPESAGKTNDDAKKSSEPPSSKTQQPHSPTEKIGGDHDKREGTGKSGERALPRKDSRFDPPRKDNRGEKRVPPKSGEHGKKREKTEPSKGIERLSPCKDDGGERRYLTPSQPKEEITSSRNTSRQDPTPAAENKSSRKPNTPKRKKPLG